MKITPKLRIVENPNTGACYFDANGTQYGFNGTPWRYTPHSRAQLVDITRDAPPHCLFDWQADPGQYSTAHYVVTTIILHDSSKPSASKIEMFIAAGSFLHIKNYLADRRADGLTATQRPIALYRDRNRARAHKLVDVRW